MMWTVEEYERRAHEAPGYSRRFSWTAKSARPATEKAVEAQEDLRQGRYDGEQDRVIRRRLVTPDSGEQQTT
jgi:hypothetical protein